MHSSAPHRAHIIVGHRAHPEPAAATPNAPLRRQAERFRMLRASACAPDGTPAEAHAHGSAPDANCPPGALAALDESNEQAGEQAHDEPSGGDGERHDDDSSGEAQGAEHPASEADNAPQACAWAFASSIAHAAAVYAAQRGTRSGASVAAVAAPACNAQDMQRLVESIVAQVSEFCSNPAVLERGDWHITIPIDPALLPGCTLTLVLSRFDLTLRFDTSEERSRQLIFQHANTLRENLDQVMQTCFDGARGIEILVF